MKCGAGNSDEAEFCISCGQKLVTERSPSSSSIPSSTAAAAAPAPAASSSINAAQAPPISDPELRSLKGTGGWLLFFCIALLIIQPVVNFVSAIGDPVGLVIAFILSGLSITTSIMLILEKRSAFAWLWWYFGVYAIVVVLAIIGTVSGGANAEEAVTFADREARLREFRDLWHGIVFLIVWVSYFKRSKRVRATFGRNLW